MFRILEFILFLNNPLTPMLTSTKRIRKWATENYLVSVFANCAAVPCEWNVWFGFEARRCLLCLHPNPRAENSRLKGGMEAHGRDEGKGPVLHIVVVGFHHKKGCQVRNLYLMLIVANRLIKVPFLYIIADYLNGELLPRTIS